MATQVLNIDSVRPVPTQVVERRTHPRLRASELRGLKTARMKYGPPISVIDLSSGGVLFETSEALRPNSIIVFEFASRTGTVVVPSRLLRCQDVSVNDDIRFEGACEFRRPLALDDFIGAALPTIGGSTARWHHVVARFRDSRSMQAYTNDFHPSKPYLNLSTTPSNAGARFTQVAQLEALYFMRTGEDETARETMVPASVTHGRRIEVTLPNGDVIIGSTLNYRRDGTGFFVHPADPLSEHARIFVTAAAIRHVRFL